MAPAHGIAVAVNELSIGGAETYGIALANRLGRHGGWNVGIAYADRSELRVSEIDARVSQLALPYRPGISRQWRNVELFWRVRHWFRANNVRVVILSSYTVGLWLAMAAKATGIPVILVPTKVADYYWPIKFARPGAWPMSAATHAIFDYYVMLSQYYYDEWSLGRCVSTKKLFFNRLGIDVNKYRPCVDADEKACLRRRYSLPCDRPVAVAAGRFMPIKHFDLALRAFARAYDPSVAPVLAVAGDGPLRGDLERSARELGMNGNIKFLGHVSEVDQLFRCCDVLLQSTEVPNLGLVTLEAIACGLPLLVNARNEEEHAMAAEACIPASNGFVVHGEEEMAAGLRTLFSEEGLRSRFATASRRLAVSTYNEDAHVVAFDKFLRNLVS